MLRTLPVVVQYTVRSTTININTIDELKEKIVQYTVRSTTINIDTYNVYTFHTVQYTVRSTTINIRMMNMSKQTLGSIYCSINYY